ncbi:MAG: sigma-54 dependent transcriptional regulator [Candidatus Cloacimonetes bacterium]|nr:sigma-54 dependent transcriptional regulator [Candidatus Cloacimonadota bacterium]
MKKLKVLILDDEKGIREEIKDFLSLYNYLVDCAETPSRAFEILKSKLIDIMILDIKLPEMDGLEVLKKVKKIQPDLEVIMITGHADMNSVLESMRSGAFDFLMKPLNVEIIRQTIERTSRFIELNNRLEKVESKYSLLKKELQERIGCRVIGKSTEIQKVIQMIRKVAEYDNTSVLITGESGTGKELVARSIHCLSPRKDNYFYPVNCSAIPEHLMESELFGHKKGAFTGAIEDKIGWFEAADSGTLFLDEIGDMPLNLQQKLLRVLEDGKIRRIGTHNEIEVDVRIIAATNQDIKKLIEDNKFRLDLYHRLNNFSIDVPPLRKRTDDIPILVEYYVQFFSEKLKKRISSVSPEIFENLKNYEFPGNVRELKNIIERAVIMCETNVLTSDDVSLSDIKIASKKCISETEDIFDLNLMEKAHIQKILQKVNKNKSQAAKLLNISWHILDRKMKKHKILP